MGLAQQKIVPFEKIAQWRKSHDGKNTVVATNGCFDVLHPGHVRYLEAAKKLGTFLWVGVNDDQGVKMLKGEQRPINTAQDRAEVLGGLASVDAVTIFPGTKALHFLEKVKPNVYVKGGDYTLEMLDAEERAVLEKMGAKIELMPHIEGKSTTATLEKIKKGESA